MDSSIFSRSSRVPSLLSVSGGLGVLVSAAGFIAGCSAAPSSPAAASADDEALSSVPQHPTRQVCTQSLGKLGYQCAATVRTDVPQGYTPDFTASADAFSPDHKTTSVSYGPPDLVSAYAIPAGGSGVTVAVINAEDDPKAEADLAVYRAKYNLPPCTTANGCFKKVNGEGKASPLPGGEYDTASEITLDLDAVSAGCPACKILLVEAELNVQGNAGVLDPFGPAVDAAVSLGAKFISISYGTPEATETANGGVLKADALAQEEHYKHPGVAIFVSSGDSGFSTSPNNGTDRKGPSFPADIPEVFAVGGTSLVKTTADARGWTEKVWGPPSATSGAGNSGCSTFFPKPSYQTSTACKGREIADLSAVADPATGFNIYITYTDPDTSAQDYIPPGWNVFGGTSLASPLTAAIFAAAGLEGVDPSFAYTNEADFNDVTTGNNGTCKEASLCNARKGYDAPTGNGTPNGAAIEGK